MSKPLRLLLADDHTLFRKGLAELLERRNSIQVVGMAANEDDALKLVLAQKPDAIVVDLNMPPQGGLHLLRRLRAEGWEGIALVLTVSDSEDDLAGALRSGARGYLLKDMEPDEVVDALHRAMRGEVVVAPAMTLKLMRLLQPGRAQSAQAHPLAQLTAREREILDYLTQGLSNKAIARALDISHDTVKLHVRHILSKLNLTSRVEAAVFATEHKAESKG